MSHNLISDRPKINIISYQWAYRTAKQIADNGFIMNSVKQLSTTVQAIYY